MDGGSRGLAAWDLTVGSWRCALIHSSSADPRNSLTNGTLRSSSLSLIPRPSSLTGMEQTRGGDAVPLFRHRFTQHHPPAPAGSLFIYFSSHLFCPQPISYQSSSPSHNQNLPRVDAQASNLSFPQRLATGLEVKLQMIRESPACPTPSRSLRDPSPACPQSRTL